MTQTVIFDITERDKKFFISTLIDYYKMIKGFVDTKAKMAAETGYQFLIEGNDLSGNLLNNSNLQHFDDILGYVTDGFYVPASSNRRRYEAGKSIKKAKVQRAPKTPAPETNTAEVEKIKRQLLSEYPIFKGRADLDMVITNYCSIIVAIKAASSSAANMVADANAIKNLNDVMVRLGGYLGINEQEKAKKKSIEDSQSVAALSLQFQTTVDEYPALMDKFRYEEVKILLEKYDRQELSRELFELPAYTGMQVEKAREFVADKER